MQLSAEKIWNSAREHLRSKLNNDTYNMWFAPLRACAIDGNNVTLEAANEFSGVWLKDNYLSLLQDAFAIAAGASSRSNSKLPREMRRFRPQPHRRHYVRRTARRSPLRRPLL